MLEKKKIVLAFGAHPDDVEFGCGGTIFLLKKLGYSVVIIDLTQGEKAKSGAGERLNEANEAAKIMGVSRKILNFGDGNISLSNAHKTEVKNVIDEYKPVLTFAPYFIDKHSDHINTAKLVSRSPNVIHYFISEVKNPNFGVDITKVYDDKLRALNAHKTQIRHGDLEWVEERNLESGKPLNGKYGELFFTKIKEINLPRIFKSV